MSILLACMEQVPELAPSLLQGQGVKFGKKSRLEAWTEAGPIGQKGADRPDGRIEVTGLRGQTWVALLEAKIGKAGLDSGQIEAYLREAKAAGANALITISNDFAVLPNHHPTYSGKGVKDVALLHWSWGSILTKCQLLISGGEIDDQHHHWLIEHLVRFLDHPNAGVIRFDQMPQDAWKEIIKAVAATAKIDKASSAALSVGAAWIQVTRDLGLKLTGRLHQPVSVKLTKPELVNPGAFMGRVLDGLCKKNALEIDYIIPDGVSILSVRADLPSKKLVSSMTVKAPADKTAKDQVKWLLRQLKNKTDEGVHVRAVYGWGRYVQKELAQVRDDPGVLDCVVGTSPPRKDKQKKNRPRFEVLLITDLSTKGMGQKNFVQALKKHVLEFYTRVGQHLRPVKSK